MKKLLLLLLLISSIVPIFGAEDFSGMRGFSLGHVKLPIYDKEQLQLMIFADSGERREQFTIGKNTTIDMLLKNVDVDKIADGWDEKLYPLNAKLPQIVKFWKKRRFTSDAVLFTPSCSIDMNKRFITGEDKVFMRCPTFDLNGVGFTSDFTTRVTEVNSDIRIIARPENCDPRAILDGAPMPQKYEIITAVSDSLRIDSKHNEIMLIGHVRAEDSSAILECDRLTIFLNDNDNQNAKNAPAKKAPAKKAPAKSSAPQPSGSVLKGVSRILADGDVVLTRKNSAADKNNPPLKGFCDHLEYEIASGLIVMSGEDSRPKVTQGPELTLIGDRIEMLRFSKTAFVSGNCDILTTSGKKGTPDYSYRRILSDKANYNDNTSMSDFQGRVRVLEKEMTMTCDRMRVFFTPQPDKDVKNTKNVKKADNKNKGTEFSPISGRREVDRIFCDGKVRIVSHPAPPPGKRGANAKPNVSVITAQRGEFDYTGNRLVFLKNVHVVDMQGSMKCQRLDLFLKDKVTNSKKQTKNAPAAAGSPGRSKVLQKSISTEKVFMQNEDSDLATDLLTMEFREMPAGTQKNPGMFKSGDVQLVKIICDGNVVAREYKKPPKPANGDNKAEQTQKAAAASAKKAAKPEIVRILKSEHAFSDLLKDFSEFHGKVSVDDFQNLLTCQDMYVYTSRHAAPEKKAPAAAPAKPAADDPDADPFALDPGENAAPSHIALSDEMDLKKIICKNDVLLTRKSPKGKPQYAGGDTAVYNINSRTIIITANRPARPYLLSDGRKQYSDIIRADLATEVLEGVGDINVIPEK